MKTGLETEVVMSIDDDIYTTCSDLRNAFKVGSRSCSFEKCLDLESKPAFIGWILSTNAQPR